MIGRHEELKKALNGFFIRFGNYKEKEKSLYEQDMIDSKIYEKYLIKALKHIENNCLERFPFPTIAKILLIAKNFKHIENPVKSKNLDYTDNRKYINGKLIPFNELFKSIDGFCHTKLKLVPDYKIPDEEETLKIKNKMLKDFK